MNMRFLGDPLPSSRRKMFLSDVRFLLAGLFTLLEVNALEVLVVTSEEEITRPFVDAMEAGGSEVTVSSPLGRGPDSFVSLLKKLRGD